MATQLVNKIVVSREGKTFEIPQVVVKLADLDSSKVEISIKPPKKTNASATQQKTATPTKPYFQIRYPHEGRMYDLLIRMKHEDKITVIRYFESYPADEENSMKQQHSIKITPISEDYLTKLDIIYQKILDFVMANQLTVLGNKQNKKREIIEEITKHVVKRDTDVEGKPYPPKIRAKVKFDPETGVPRMEVWRKENQQLVQLEIESIEALRNEFISSADKVITLEPSFYVMGTQCGWTLGIHSMLLGEKTSRPNISRPTFTVEDAEDIPIQNLEIKEEVVIVETPVTNIREEETTIASSDDEQENFDLPPPPKMEEQPISVPKTTRGRVQRK